MFSRNLCLMQKSIKTWCWFPWFQVRRLGLQFQTAFNLVRCETTQRFQGDNEIIYSRFVGDKNRYFNLKLGIFLKSSLCLNLTWAQAWDVFVHVCISNMYLIAMRREFLSWQVDRLLISRVEALLLKSLSGFELHVFVPSKANIRFTPLVRE